MIARIFCTLYTWVIFTPLFLLLTIITALLTITGCLAGGAKIFAYYPGMIWSRLTCYLALCPVVVRGRETLDKHCSYVFVSNHQGAFDIFLIYGFLGLPVKWVMKEGLKRIPLVGAACKAAGFIFVGRSTAQAAARSIREAGSALSTGASIAIFPEGSRTRDGRMGKFKKGAFLMAAGLHLPIAPITLNGPFHVFPIGSYIIRPHRMEMIIHRPIPTDGISGSNEEIIALSGEAHRVIASGLWREYLS
ncbi:MAG: 1-acyl-sn-glycerol-3-phosphate acyltransferase [Tannerellaceae bacterium]|jgi:1-acyl-sn-glycerol-3-phosphate acyltransferase|nr:1-acyl-sn-glycerol-3-phosphate acyltransferase [Tannerellaceae bacterium]